MKKLLFAFILVVTLTLVAPSDVLAASYIPDPIATLSSNRNMAITGYNKIEYKSVVAPGGTTSYVDQVPNKYSKFTSEEIGNIAGTYAYSVTGYGGPSVGFNRNVGLAHQYDANNEVANQNLIKLAENLTTAMTNSLNEYNNNVDIQNKIIAGTATDAEKQQFQSASLQTAMGDTAAYEAVQNYRTQNGWSRDSGYDTLIGKTEEEVAKQKDQIIWCVRGGGALGLSFEINPMGCVASFAYVILWLTSWVLFVAGKLFDGTMFYTLNIANLINFNAGGVVNIGWSVIRDICNSFFIFILLYIGIAMILRMEQYGNKKLVGSLIIAALLINFSLFFAKVIVDMSNSIALQFYATIHVSDTSNNSNFGPDSGIAAGIINDLGMSSVWGVGSQAYKVGDPNASAPSKSLTGQIPLNPTTMAMIGFGGSILMLVLAFILIAAAGMFLLRTVTIIFLLILAPVGFIGRVLPSTQGYAKEWWDKMTKTAIFAPVFMLLLYVSMRMLKEFGSRTLGASGTARTVDGFAGFLTGNSANVQIILTFVIICAMFLYSLVLADKMGAKGAKTFQGWGSTLRKNALSTLGRNTIGKGANMLQSSETFRNAAAGWGKNFGLGAGLRQLDNLSKNKFGGNKSYIGVQEDRVKQLKRTGDLIKGDLIKKQGESALDFRARENARIEMANKYLGNRGGLTIRERRARAIAANSEMFKKKDGAADKIKTKKAEWETKIGIVRKADGTLDTPNNSAEYSDANAKAASDKLLGTSGTRGLIEQKKELRELVKTTTGVVERNRYKDQLAAIESEIAEYQEIVNENKKAHDQIEALDIQLDQLNEQGGKLSDIEKATKASKS